jgi:hypothetical protein
MGGNIQVHCVLLVDELGEAESFWLGNVSGLRMMVKNFVATTNEDVIGCMCSVCLDISKQLACPFP